MLIVYLLLGVVSVMASSVLCSMMYLFATWKTSFDILSTVCEFKATDVYPKFLFRNARSVKNYELTVIYLSLLYILIFLPWSIIYNHIKGRF